MTAEGAAHLAEAARRRSQSARRRAREAIVLLDRKGQPVTFASVADQAGVSRSWPYRAGDLRAEIERLRAHGPPRTTPVPVGQRATADSYNRRIETLLDANAALRRENQQLKDQLARLLGEHRNPRRS